MADSRKVQSEREKKPPIIERTETRGESSMEFPVWGGKFKAKGPATNRSLMLIIFAMCSTFCVTATICCWLIFVRATAENIESVGDLVGGRKPEKRQTPDGMTIEVCPPCPACENCDCTTECPCPMCLPQQPCPAPQKIAPTVVPPVEIDKRQL